MVRALRRVGSAHRALRGAHGELTRACPIEGREDDGEDGVSGPGGTGGVRVVYPFDGASFVVNPEPPAALQAVDIRVEAGGPVEVRVDGVLLAAPYRWVLAPGAHTISTRAARGERRGGGRAGADSRAVRRGRSVCAPNGRVLVASDTGDPEANAEVPYSADASARKARTEERLAALGVPVARTLPPVLRSARSCRATRRRIKTW